MLPLSRSAVWRTAQGQLAPSLLAFLHTSASGRAAGGPRRGVAPQEHAAQSGFFLKMRQLRLAATANDWISSKVHRREDNLAPVLIKPVRLILFR